MKRFNSLAVLALITVLLGLSVPAVIARGGPGESGSGIPQPGLEELVNQADLIVVGTVTHLNSYWNPEHTHIFTDVSVSVGRAIKGTPGGDVVVKAPGGTAEGITEWVSEAPGFIVGERALLLLKTEGEGLYALANWRWGKQIIEDETALPLNLPLSQVINDIGEILRSRSLPDPAGDWVETEASFTLPTPLSGAPPAITPPATAGWQNIITEDFEGPFPGTTWTLAGDPTWGKDDYKPYTGTYSGWCARGGSSGQDPQYNNYPNDMSAWMVYGPFDLSDASDAELNFYYWNKSELIHDKLSWMASVNGTDFYGTQVTGNSAGWVYRSFDLTSVPILGNLAGQSSVWIAFRFGSDSTNTDQGAFLDDIVLRKYVTTEPAPTISSITPSSASAGTGSDVTISGSSFGATQGSSKVTFYYRAGQPRIEAPIVSWSDASIVATVPVGIINNYYATASSGPVIVTTSGGDSNGYQFAVTFSYIGAKWPGASPDVHYRINPNTADVTGEEVAVRAATNTWSTVSGADFTFVYDGTTSATQAGYNGTNEVMWRNLGGTGTIARNWWWTDASGNYLEFDQEYNDGYVWSTTGAPGTFDIQGIATHELGHALGLRDLYGNVGSPNDTQKTMYGFGATGETQARTLEPDDQAGVIWIYPTSGNTPPTISGLPDRSLDENTSLNDTIDLWSYASDLETPDSQLAFSKTGDTNPNAGVSIDANRYIDINPTTDWCGESDVTIRVTDPGSLWDEDTFRVTVNCISPDLVLTKNSSAPTVATGGSVTFTLTSSNTGTATASGYFIDDFIPAGVTITAFTATDSAGCAVGSDATPPWVGPATIRCGSFTTAASGSDTVTLTATVTAGPGTILNGALTDSGDDVAESNEDADDPDLVCTSVGEGSDAAPATEPDNYDCLEITVTGAPATLSVSPASQTVNVGDSFTTSINIASVTNLQGADITINYDPTKMSFQSFSNGSILPADVSPSPLCSAGSCNYRAVRTGAAFSGSGTLLTITWQALAATASTTTDINVSVSQLSDPDGVLITFTATDGTVTITVGPGTGSISAHKFRDDDQDGLQAGAEPDLSGWTMTLYSGSGCGGSVLNSGTTNSSGDRLFSDLAAGTYSVGETLQSGWANTTPTCQNEALSADENATLNFGNTVETIVSSLGIGSATIAPGESVTLDVVVNATDPGIGFYTIDVVYDSALVDATACTAVGGVCNTDFGPNTVRLGAFSVSGLNGTLGTVTFEAGAAEGVAGLDVQVVELADVVGNLVVPQVVNDGTISIVTPTFGFLRVTTSPAVPSQISIDGIPRDTWGLVWLKLPPGSYEVSFSDVQGFTTPDSQVVTVSEGVTTTVTGVFSERGFLRVVTDPPVPGTIFVDGVPRDDWGMWTDLAVGTYTVCFGPVDGYDAPACQLAGVTAGSTTTAIGYYSSAPSVVSTSAYGFLRVTTSPAVPSQISIDGIPRDTWGLVWLKLPPGSYEVSFSDVQGFTTPDSQVVTVSDGATTTVTGVFSARGFLRVVTNPAVPATIFVDGVPRNDWGMWTGLAVGTYTVCFGPVEGYDAPACQLAEVTAGSTIVLSGNYVAGAPVMTDPVVNLLKDFSLMSNPLQYRKWRTS